MKRNSLGLLFGLFATGSLVLDLAPKENGIRFLSLILFVSGASLKVWAAGFLSKNLKLSFAGPYRWTRHPQYLGNCLMGLGLCLQMPKAHLIFVIACFALLFFWSHAGVIRYEEIKLRNRFGQKHLEYCKKTPLFFPGWPTSTECRLTKFSLKLALSNRAYEWLLAGLGFSSLVLLKK